MSIRTALCQPRLARVATIATFTAIAAMALVAVPAPAQTIEFQGSAIVHDFSPECREAGWHGAAQSVVMRYYPAGLGDNSDSASFSFNQSLGAMGFHQPDGGFDRQFRPVEGMAIFGSSWSFSNARVRFNRQAPAQLGADTNGPVRINGQIRNFGGAARCNLRFAAVLVRLP